jgi:hypothetical protein
MSASTMMESDHALKIDGNFIWMNHGLAKVGAPWFPKLA